MDRRFPLALLALAVAALAALLVLAKRARRWRPLEIGAVPLDTNGFVAAVQTSGDLVAVLTQKRSTEAMESAFFRASMGEVLPRRGRLLGTGEWTWLVRDADAERQTPRQIELADETGQILLFDVPASSDWETRKLKGLHLTPGQRLELAVGDDYLCWALDAPGAPRQLKLAQPCYAGVFSDDGASLLIFDTNYCWRLSTQTGEVISRAATPAQDRTNWIGLSLPGNYCVANSFDEERLNGVVWHVTDTYSGRVLWSFELEQNQPRDAMREPVLAPDESVIAVPSPDRKNWVIHDFATGKIQRTWPLVPHAKSAAFSPDGNEIYSLVGSTLYRQRAR